MKILLVYDLLYPCFMIESMSLTFLYPDFWRLFFFQFQ